MKKNKENKRKKLLERIIVVGEYKPKIINKDRIGRIAYIASSDLNYLKKLRSNL